MSLKITSSIMFILHFITFTATFNTLQCVSKTNGFVYLRIKYYLRNTFQLSFL